MRRLTCGTLVQTVQLARASGDQAKCCHISKLIQQARPTEHKVTQFLSSLNRARSGLVAKVERAARPARAAALETCIAPRGANRSQGIGTPPVLWGWVLGVDLPVPRGREGDGPWTGTAPPHRRFLVRISVIPPYGPGTNQAFSRETGCRMLIRDYPLR